jgi:hypothetical protein
MMLIDANILIYAKCQFICSAQPCARLARSATERLSNIVDTSNPHAPQCHGSGLHRLTPLMPLPNIIETSTQRLIDQLFQAESLAAAQSFESGGYIVIEGQRCSHHQNIIMVMS